MAIIKVTKIIVVAIIMSFVLTGNFTTTPLTIRVVGTASAEEGQGDEVTSDFGESNDIGAAESDVGSGVGDLGVSADMSDVVGEGFAATRSLAYSFIHGPGRSNTEPELVNSGTQVQIRLHTVNKTCTQVLALSQMQYVDTCSQTSTHSYNGYTHRILRIKWLPCGSIPGLCCDPAGCGGGGD